MSTPFDEILSDVLAERESRELLRRRRVVRPLDATHVEVDGRTLVNFASNNYLGLTHHPRIIAAMTQATIEHGAGSGAAGLISGYTPLHADAEQALARWKGTQDAVLLPSGYQANHAAIQTIAASAEAAGRPVRFLIDKLVHASLIDAVRGSGQQFRVFPHNGLDKLARLLADADANELQVVVTESIFSMDGDAADLEGLAQLKQRRSFLLVVDEAHGSGVYGPNGSGYAAERGVTDAVDVFVVTLSKALGTIGGAVCASSTFCDALVNLGRAYVFSTSVPPAIAAGAMAAIDVMRAEPRRQRRVRDLAARVRAELSRANVSIPSGDSPIIPIIVGEESRALATAKALEEGGLLVLPIRPPTVPRRASRLRVTLSAAHTDAEIDQLLESIRQPVAR